MVAKFVVLTFARARSHWLGHAVKVNHCSASQGGEIRILRLADYFSLPKDCMGSTKSWLTGGWGELSLDKFIGTAGCESGLVSKTWGAREN